MAQTGDLRGRTVFVISSGCDLLDGVVRGLIDLDARVAVLRETPSAVGEHCALDLRSRDSAGQSIDAAIVRIGAPDLVVLSFVPSEAMRIASIADWSDDAWRDATMGALRATMWLLDALGRHLKPRGVGSIVMIAPSLSLVGTPQMVALSTLLEGQRGLMKTIARQWGASGVRLNWISAAPRALSSLFDEAPLAAKPDAVSVALGRGAEPRGEIAPVLAFLASDAGRAFTGATLMLDGGEWMTP